MSDPETSAAGWTVTGGDLVKVGGKLVSAAASGVAIMGQAIEIADRMGLPLGLPALAV